MDRLLRNLKSGGHRVLIFTQMSKMLNTLKSFLNIYNYRNLRLDGWWFINESYRCQYRASV